MKLVFRKTSDNSLFCQRGAMGGMCFFSFFRLSKNRKKSGAISFFISLLEYKCSKRHVPRHLRYTKCSEAASEQGFSAPPSRHCPRQRMNSHLLEFVTT
jgi:hypothetical protein